MILIFLSFGLRRLKKFKSVQNPYVSVIVAARNEEKNINTLIHALSTQDYPKKRYEIIIVNDRSQDKTKEIVEKARQNHANISLYNITKAPQTSPKKNAVALGIKNAKGEIILLTDADCIPQNQWISHMINYFEPEYGMVIGFSPYDIPKISGLLDYFTALDALSIAAIAAGTTAWGYPATCSGRNLGYRKKVFQKVGGFKSIEKFISGDDDLFLNLVLTKTRWKVAYAYDKKTVVPTQTLEDFDQFLNQRLRHASKGFYYEWKKMLILIGLYVYNLIILLAFISSLFIHDLFIMAILSLTVKSLFEFIFLYTFAKKMDRLFYLKYYPVVALLHIPYVVILGGLGQLVKFKWKGEKHKKLSDK